MDRPSSTQAKEADITLRVDPDREPRRDNVYSRALQEQERRRQVAAGRRRGGAASVASFDGPPQWSQDGPRVRTIGAPSAGAPSREADARRGRPQGRRATDMFMALPPRPDVPGENPKVGWDDVRPFEAPQAAPAGSDGFIARPDRAEPRTTKDVNIPVYEWFTCNIANLRCGPAAAAPYVRFTGFFGGPRAEEEAQRHIEKEGRHGAIGQCGIVSYKFQARHIVVAGIDPERCTSKSVADRKKRVVLEAVYEWAAERQRQFDENVRKHQHGKVGLTARHKRELKRKQKDLRELFPVPAEEIERRKAQAEEFSAVMAQKAEEAKTRGEEPAYDLASGPPPYPIAMEIRGQKFVVVTVVPDESVTIVDPEDEEAGGEDIKFSKWQDAEGCGFEPLFIAQTCAPDEEKADLYSRDGVWQKYLDAENLTAPMYEWLPLNEIDDPRIQNHWFDAEQDLVMKRQQQDVLEAQKFAELCHNLGKKMPVIDLTDPEGKGMIPAMRKGELEGEELEEALKAQEEAKAKEDALMSAPIEEIRKMELSDPRKNRTFIRADGTVDEAKPSNDAKLSNEPKETP